MRIFATFPWPTIMRAVPPRIWSVVRSSRVPSTGAPPTANACWCGIRTRRTVVRTWRATWSVWRRITRPPSKDCQAIWRHSRRVRTLTRGAGESIFGWTGLDPSSEVTKVPYPHDVLHLRVQGAFSDNASPSIVPAGIVREWNERWAYPQLRLATNSEFFTEAEERLAGGIETYSGDWTDWWVDGIGSGARHLGFKPRAPADVRTAQTLHTLADALAEDGVDRRQDEIDEAYESMALFDEHTWGLRTPGWTAWRGGNRG